MYEEKGERQEEHRNMWELMRTSGAAGTVLGGFGMLPIKAALMRPHQLSSYYARRDGVLKVVTKFGGKPVHCKDNSPLQTAISRASQSVQQKEKLGDTCLQLVACVSGWQNV